jgi:DnaB-like helicase C terminal domain
MLEKYNSTPDYQDRILACIIQHPERFMCYTGVLNAAYFSGNARIVTARNLFLYCKKYSRFPAWDVLVQKVYDEIESTPDQKEEENIMSYLKRLKDMNTGDIDSVVEDVVKFARKRAYLIALEEAFVYWQENKEPPGGFESLFKEASQVGINFQDFGYLIGPNQEDSILKVIEEYLELKPGIKLGATFHLLDEVWKNKGGIRPGWLIAILAPPKRYKTTLCVNLALSIAYGGKPVFYYPCEITQIDAALRTFQCLTDRSDAMLMDNPRAFTELTIKRANEAMGAPVLIKGYPMRGVTIGNDIRAHALASRQQLGITPAAIFIDHAECVRCSSTKKDISDHRAQGEIYIEGKNLALEMGCPVFLPDRCNAETVDRVTPTMRGFQGAFEKAGHVDAGLALCANEQEHSENQVRYFVFLNRHGKAGLHFRGIVNPETQRMTLDDKIPWNPEDDDWEEKKKGGKRGSRRHPRRPIDPDQAERIMG